jgi:16S rRNA (guanine527-N7)-methyltransferase
LAIIKFIKTKIYFQKSYKIIDIGSGAGLPGIIISIALKEYSNIEVSMLDSNNKKTAFIQQAAIELGLLSNTKVINKRVENHNGSYNMIVSRAFANLSDFISKTKHLLAEDGIILAMKAKFAKVEVLDCKMTTNIHQLDVPFLSEERYLIEIG